MKWLHFHKCISFALQLHPDVLNGNESAKVKAEVNARYLAVSEAYAVLSKPKDRRIYDLGLPRQRSGEEEGEESQTGRR